MDRRKRPSEGDSKKHGVCVLTIQKNKKVMNFSIFNSIKGKGVLCTPELFLQTSESEQVRQILIEIQEAVSLRDKATDAKEARKYKNKIAKLKTRLPAITWQALFPDGERKNDKAVPSGLFMIDIDHVEEPGKIWSKQIAPKVRDCGIVYCGKTPSGQGIRVVAHCRPEFGTLQECQQWLGMQLGVEIDEVCKDWARSSFVVHREYFYYLDNEALFGSPRCTYEVAHGGSTAIACPAAALPDKDGTPDRPDSGAEPLPGEMTLSTYKGVPLMAIADAWLNDNGGYPEEGHRHTGLYTLATRMRHVCGYNAQVMFHNMPHFGLDDAEVWRVVNSAAKGSDTLMPKDMEATLSRLTQAGEDPADDEEASDDYMEAFWAANSTAELPPLPPVFKEWVEAAPDDFKRCTIAVLLPVLGTLGSKLRARYFDKRLHSPSFQVSIEAEQSSGKSFMTMIAEYCLKAIEDHDTTERAREERYIERLKDAKTLNMRMNKKEKMELIGDKPEALIRLLPATVSITKLLIRQKAAQGLHCFAMAEEIDTVHKAFKRGFADISDLLRNAFDNSKYGQDFASDASFSGTVPLYYNTLFSGTPAAMRRFYPNVENGTVSRVLFVELPDQFGKSFTPYADFTEAERKTIDKALARLNEVSIKGDEVQDDYVMDIDWLSRAMECWGEEQRAYAVSTNDRSRDVFRKRSAVVGFRAGMLAYFLYGERDTRPVREKVVQFARWVANVMVQDHVNRFDIEKRVVNTVPYFEVFDVLPKEFSSGDVTTAAKDSNVASSAKMIISRWKRNGLVKKVSGNTRQEGVYVKR